MSKFANLALIVAFGIGVISSCARNDSYIDCHLMGAEVSSVKTSGRCTARGYLADRLGIIIIENSQNAGRVTVAILDADALPIENLPLYQDKFLKIEAEFSITEPRVVNLDIVRSIEEIESGSN